MKSCIDELNSEFRPSKFDTKYEVELDFDKDGNVKAWLMLNGRKRFDEESAEKMAETFKSLAEYLRSKAYKKK